MLKSSDLNREKLLSLFKKQDFPSRMFDQSVLKVSQILFNSSSLPPVSEGSSITISKQSFIKEDSFDQKKKRTEPIKAAPNKGNFKPVGKPKTQKEPVKRKEDEVDTDLFFDNFLGKSDTAAVQAFISSNSLSIATTDSISLIVSAKRRRSSRSKMQYIQEKVYSCNPKSFVSAPKQGTENLKRVDLSGIYEFNKKLSYEFDKPLWYLFNNFTNSSFGPVSSVEVENMYKDGSISDLSYIRLIDLFILKSQNPFSFFQIKDLANANLFERMQPSPLNSYIESIRQLIFDKDSNTIELQKVEEDKGKTNEAVEEIETIKVSLNSAPKKKKDKKKIEVEQIGIGVGQCKVGNNELNYDFSKENKHDDGLQYVVGNVRKNQIYQPQYQANKVITAVVFLSRLIKSVIPIRTSIGNRLLT